TPMSMGYPAAQLATAALPPPPPPPPPAESSSSKSRSKSGARQLPPGVVEARRVAGLKTIVPDDDTKRTVERNHDVRLIGSWKLCIDEDGKPSRITQLKSTGYEGYDALIEKGMRGWRYRPYEVDGKYVAVCTAVTFVYTQE